MAKGGHQPFDQAALGPGGKLRSPRRKQGSLNLLSGTPTKTSDAPAAPTRPRILGLPCGQRSPAASRAARSPAAVPRALVANPLSQKQNQQQPEKEPLFTEPPPQPVGAAPMAPPAPQEAPAEPSPAAQEPWANIPLPEVFDCSPLQMMQEALQQPMPPAAPAPAAATVEAASPAQVRALPQTTPQIHQDNGAAAGCNNPWSWVAAAAHPGQQFGANAPPAPPAEPGARAGTGGGQTAAAAHSAVSGPALQGALAMVDGLVSEAQEHSTGASQEPPQAAAPAVSSPMRQPGQPQSAPAKAAPSPTTAAVKPGSASVPVVPDNRRSDAPVAGDSPAAQPVPVGGPVGSSAQGIDAASMGQERAPQAEKAGGADNQVCCFDGMAHNADCVDDIHLRISGCRVLASDISVMLAGCNWS